MRDWDNCTNFADNWRRCGQLLTKCFRGRDVSLVTNQLILVLIRITIRMPEFSTEFLPLPDRRGGSCKNFVGSAALEEVCGLRVLLVLKVLLLMFFYQLNLHNIPGNDPVTVDSVDDGSSCAHPASRLGNSSSLTSLRTCVGTVQTNGS